MNDEEALKIFRRCKRCVFSVLWIGHEPPMVAMKCQNPKSENFNKRSRGVTRCGCADFVLDEKAENGFINDVSKMS